MIRVNDKGVVYDYGDNRRLRPSLFFFLPTDSGLNKNFQGFFPAKPHLNNGLIQLIFCFVLVSIHFLLMFPFLVRLI